MIFKYGQILASICLLSFFSIHLQIKLKFLFHQSKFAYRFCLGFEPHGSSTELRLSQCFYGQIVLQRPLLIYFFPGIYFFTISNISWLNKYNLYISQTDYLYVVYVQQKLLKQKIFERALFWLSQLIGHLRYQRSVVRIQSLVNYIYFQLY